MIIYFSGNKILNVFCFPSVEINVIMENPLIGASTEIV